jgi:predicted CXXCH cytochrome family protein
VTRVALALLATTLLGACQRAAPIVQPIQYSHKVHIDNNIACPACHQSVEKAAAASLPGDDICMICHQAALSDNPEEEKVRQYAVKGQAIPWRRIYRLPEHVYFSHRRHVTVAGIACGQCHGAVASLTAPAPYPLVNQSMTWCLGCHRARGATQDCIHCHR